MPAGAAMLGWPFMPVDCARRLDEEPFVIPLVAALRNEGSSVY